MSRSSPRYGAALLLSIAVHAVFLFVLLYATKKEAPPETKEVFIDLSFSTLESPKPPEPPPTLAPEPVPEPVPAPTVTEAPKETPKPTPKVAAAPAERPGPVAGLSSDDEITASVNAPDEGAMSGTDPTIPGGKEGSPYGSGINFDPKAQLPLYGLGGIVDMSGARRGPGAKKVFIREQAGGATVALSSVNAGNQRQLGKVKKVFVGYLRKMHEKLHKTWAEDALIDFKKIDCDSAISDIDLQVTLELVLDTNGRLEKAAPIITSGVNEFDIAAVGAVFDASPFPKPPKYIHSYDGKVYIHWEMHRDNRQCGSVYAQAYILTNEKTESATLPVEEEFTEEEFTEIAALEKAMPTLPESKGFAKEFAKAVSGFGESCKERLKLLKESIQEDGFVKTLIKEKLKVFLPEDGSAGEEAFVNFLRSFKTEEFCPGTPMYVFAHEPPKGPADELSFPVGQCDPSCRHLCFNF